MELLTQNVESPEGPKVFYYLHQKFLLAIYKRGRKKVVKHCTFCAPQRIKTRKCATKLKLFPATEQLMYFIVDILGPLINFNNGNSTLLVITQPFSKSTKSVPLRSTTAQDIATAFAKHSVLYIACQASFSPTTVKKLQCVFPQT